jgi:hypothetical protein
LVEEWISVGTFRAKEKITARRNRPSIGRCRKSPTLIIERKELPKALRQKARIDSEALRSVGKLQVGHDKGKQDEGARMTRSAKITEQWKTAAFPLLGFDNRPLAP